MLFGEPMGSGYGRFEGEGRWVEYAPHNWYVTLLLRVGVAGLAVFVVLIVGAFAGALGRRDMLAATIVATVTVFGWAYSVPWYACIPLGWAMCEASIRQDVMPGFSQNDTAFRRSMSTVWHRGQPSASGARSMR